MQDGGQEHRCGAKPKTLFNGQQQSSRVPKPTTRASRRHVQEGEFIVDSSDLKASQQNPEEDASVAGSIMNIFQKVSDIEVRVEYIDSSPSEILKRFKLPTSRTTNQHEPKSGTVSRKSP
ncbi:hypothetical protein HPB50_023179 [Hyalomma asiaticum]|uniref:Uncharacterized protein n=1 Tax=Hyalomma asiaticum TaxID=266040 RepID=A0ACB7TMQ8_HYAAI|nr:hypothetical protein HPB50_023179 [Hyalomma asiaticum]